VEVAYNLLVAIGKRAAVSHIRPPSNERGKLKFTHKMSIAANLLLWRFVTPTVNRETYRPLLTRGKFTDKRTVVIVAMSICFARCTADSESRFGFVRSKYFDGVDRVVPFARKVICIGI
jgi:hypothetical protein